MHLSNIFFFLLESDNVTVESPTPDKDVFRHLAKIYSYNHGTMSKKPKKHLGDDCNVSFDDGITNGAKWYSFEGKIFNSPLRGLKYFHLVLRAVLVIKKLFSKWTWRGVCKIYYTQTNSRPKSLKCLHEKRFSSDNDAICLLN